MRYDKIMICLCKADMNHPLRGSYKEGWVTCQCGKVWVFNQEQLKWYVKPKKRYRKPSTLS